MSRLTATALALVAATLAACGGPKPPSPTAPTAPVQSTFSDSERVAIVGHLLATGLDALDLIATPPTSVPQAVHGGVTTHSIACPSYTVTTDWGFPFSGRTITSCTTVTIDGQLTLKETIETVAAPDIFTSCMPDIFCVGTQVYYFPQGRIDITGQVQPKGRTPNGRMSWSGALQITGSLVVGKSPTSPIVIALNQVRAELDNFPNQSGGQISGDFLSSGSSPLPLATPLARTSPTPDLVPGNYQLMAIDGNAPPKDIGLLDIFPPAGGCDLTIDGGTLDIGGASGPNGYDFEVQGHRSNCTDGSGKPFTGAALNGGERGTWTLTGGTLAFSNVPAPEYQIDAAGFSGGIVVLGVTAWPHSNGGPFHLVLAFARS